MRKNILFMLVALAVLFGGCKKEEYADSLGYTGTKVPKDFQNQFVGTYQVKCTYTYISIPSLQDQASYVVKISKTDYKGIMKLDKLYSSNSDKTGITGKLYVEETGAFTIGDHDVQYSTSGDYTNGTGNMGSGGLSYSYKTNGYNCSCTTQK